MTRIFKHIKDMRAFAIIILFISVTACNQNQETVNSKKEETLSADKAGKYDSVKVFVLKMDSAQKIVSIPGELLPNENVQIRAKVQGYIKKLNVDIGSFVGNANEKPLFELDDNSTLRLRVAIPEIFTGAVLANNTGDLTTRSFPDKKFKAKLVRKSGSIDNQTRSEVWEFEVPNPNGKLIPGSYADVKIHFVRPQKSFVMPTTAVVTTLERKFVIKVSNNTTQWVDVRAGFNMGEKQEIFGDLKAGDSLVLKGTEELKGGTKIIAKLSN